MGKKKTKTSSTETSRTVTTPTRPDWVDAQVRGRNEALTGRGAQDPAAQVAPLSDLERRATEGAAGLGVAPGGGRSAAADPAGTALAGRGEVPQSASVLDNLSAYMTPFRDQVLNAAMDDYDA
ncbi:MAG: hypothetical protein ACKOD3_06025, partial [Phenylobacterium sp.]